MGRYRKRAYFNRLDCDVLYYSLLLGSLSYLLAYNTRSEQLKIGISVAMEEEINLTEEISEGTIKK